MEGWTGGRIRLSRQRVGENDMQSTEATLIFLVAAIGVLVLIQAVVMIAMSVSMTKGMRGASDYSDEMKTKIIPVLDQLREMMETAKHLIERLEPRLEAAANDLAEITRTASDEVKKMQASADEIAERVRRQAARMDSLTTSALDNVDRAGRLLNSAVTAPVRQVSGVMAAVKAIVDVLRTPTPGRRRAAPDGHAHPEPARDDQFV
jgi:methyl-accepting chemotaxis protein